MLASETTASISDHRLLVQDGALPIHAEKARVIVLWDAPAPSGRHSPPPELAGKGEEKGDILAGPPMADWDALA